MRERLNKLIKPNGAIVLFGSEPFSSALRMSNIKNYKYDWIWEKERASNFFLAKKQSMKYHEIISIFYKKQPTYNPQMRKGKENHSWWKWISKSDHYWTNKFVDRENSEMKYPKSIIKFNKDKWIEWLHPTQKPVALMEYLIKTYTNEWELILDFTAGSGSTLVAAKNTNRKYIWIEMEEKYVDIIKERLDFTP